jgi:hypothetical protein
MRLHASILGLAILAAGCGGGPAIAPVSGRVTLDGKAVPNATVIFQPISQELNPGPGSQAKTDSEGRFTLQLMNGQQSGALVGLHKVSITAYDGADEVPSSGSNMVFRKSLIPEEYNARSKLTFTVTPEGSSTANFDLPIP